MVNNPEGTAQVAPTATMSPLPAVQVPTTPAPKLTADLSKKPGSAHVGARTNYSRVNTGAPMVSDAGASSQKSLQPKMAGAFFKSQSEVPMTHAAARPTLQQMLKHAMAGAASAIDSGQIAAAARSQLEVGGNRKEASAPPEGQPISREYAHKLASAVDYYAEVTFGKVAEDAPTSPGHGPGALDVTESMDGPPISEDSGQATSGNQPPMNPGTGKVAPNAVDAATALDNDADHRPGAGAEKSWSPDGDSTRFSKVSQIERIRKLAAGRVVDEQRQQAMGRIMATAEEKLDRDRARAGEKSYVPFEGKRSRNAPKPSAAPKPPAPKPSAAPKVKPSDVKKGIGIVRRIRNMSRRNKALAGAALGLGTLGAGYGAYRALSGKEKAASSQIGLIRKLAEDAINPANITAAHNAPEPQTLEASDPGPPGENKGMLPTTPEGVADATKRTVKAPFVKKDMPDYVDEPAFSEPHDKVLQNAFAKTDESGAKISSIDATSAARALFNRLAEEA
jgi:hypothetical protein